MDLVELSGFRFIHKPTGLALNRLAGVIDSWRELSTRLTWLGLLVSTGFQSLSSIRNRYHVLIDGIESNRRRTLLLGHGLDLSRRGLAVLVAELIVVSHELMLLVVLDQLLLSDGALIYYRETSVVGLSECVIQILDGLRALHGIRVL